MIQMLLWLIILLLFLLISYVLSKGQIIAPEFCFVACFIPQAIYAFWYIEKWDFQLGVETLLVLTGGVALFLVVSGIVALFYQNSRNTNRPFLALQPSKEIAAWKLNALLLFQIFTCLFTIVFFVSSFQTSLQNAIKYFRAQSFAGYEGVDYEVTMPGLLRFCRRFSVASGYFFAYLLILGFIEKNRRLRKVILANFILSIVNGFISTGGRQALFEMAVSTVTMYIILNRIYNRKKNIKFKTILKIIALAVLLISSFKMLGVMVGRNIQTDYSDYLARYLCAPLKNLDIYLNKGTFGISNISQSVVFSTVASILGMGRKLSETPYVYNHINGFNLGNAYTVYFAYIHDFGYGGMIVFITLEAAVCQILYQKSMKTKKINEISIPLLLYSYLLFGVAFSFFGAFFPSALFSKIIVWNILTWWGLKWFFKVKFTFGHKKKAPAIDTPFRERALNEVE